MTRRYISTLTGTLRLAAFVGVLAAASGAHANVAFTSQAGRQRRHRLHEDLP